MQHHAKTLIIVEDEPMIAIMVEQMVSDLGWEVHGCAHSERDGFALLENLKPSVALLDINLGTATSLGVAALCRDRGISVIYVTGYSGDEIPRQCRDAPVLTKPLSSDELARALEGISIQTS